MKSDSNGGILNGCLQVLHVHVFLVAPLGTVCGGKDGVISDKFPPCGVCRQVMREFCDDNFMIYMVDNDNTYSAITLAELLPYSFSPDNVSNM